MKRTTSSAHESRWTIDTSNLKSVSDVRRAVVRKLGSVGQRRDDQFAAEILIGEILIDEITTKPQALMLEVTHDDSTTTLHVYSQARHSTEPDLRELEKRLMSSCGLPIKADLSDQGLHIEVAFHRRRFWMKRPLQSLWDVARCVLSERAQRMREKKPDRRRRAG